MNYLLFIFVVSFVFFLLQWSNARKDYLTVKRLTQEFDEWIKSDGNSKKPNNAEFTRLFKKMHGKSTFKQDVVRGNSAVMITEATDVVASFPTLHGQLIAAEVGLLDNMYEYFELHYKDVLTLNFWLNFVIFLPAKIIEYLDISESKKLTKTMNAFYWLLSTVYILWKPAIQNFLQKLFE